MTYEGDYEAIEEMAGFRKFTNTGTYPHFLI